jgi:hypothetical protein
MVDRRSDAAVRRSGVFDKDKLKCFVSKSWSGLCVTLVIKPHVSSGIPECTRVVDLIGLLDLHR